MSAALPHPPLVITRRSGHESLTAGGKPIGPTLLDFWQWSASDLSNNAMRGVLAEFLVASAVGVAEGVRAGWDAYDLTTPSGITVEVKSSSPWQSWFQKVPSVVQFAIRPTRAWDATTNELAIEARRQANVYVFAVLQCDEKSQLDPLDCDQWSFYVLPASTLNERFVAQKMVTLNTLRGVGADNVAFAELSAAIERAGENGGGPA